MAKKKIDKSMLGGRKRKPLDEKELEKAVSQIHEPVPQTPVQEEVILPILKEEVPSISVQAEIIEKETPVVQSKIKKKTKSETKKEVAKPVRFSFNMSKALHLKFKIHCLEKDSTMQDEILMMIQKVVSRK